MPKHAETDAKDRILDAAEKAFADAGFDGASLRDIVKVARVNLATVYYYFQSKEGLMAAVVQRRFAPLRAEHLNMLNELRTQAGNKPLPIEKIIEAMVTPSINLAITAPCKSEAVRRLVGRIVAEPNERNQELLRGQFAPFREGVMAELRRSLPKLPPSDLQWRYEFIIGAFAFTLANACRIKKEAGGICDPGNTKALILQMVHFFSGGLRAAACSESKLAQ
jgi:AcrR family transcriptional regulator